jgi:hypothetical protein
MTVKYACFKNVPIKVLKVREFCSEWNIFFLKRHLWTGKYQCLQITVFCYGLLMRNRGYIEFETLEKQCWSYLRNIKRTFSRTPF